MLISSSCLCYIKDSDCLKGDISMILTLLWDSGQNWDKTGYVIILSDMLEMAHCLACHSIWSHPHLLFNLSCPPASPLQALLPFCQCHVSVISCVFSSIKCILVLLFNMIFPENFMLAAPIIQAYIMLLCGLKNAFWCTQRQNFYFLRM